MLSPSQQKQDKQERLQETSEKDEQRKKTAALLAKNKRAALDVLHGAIASMEGRTPRSVSQVKRDVWI